MDRGQSFLQGENQILEEKTPDDRHFYSLPPQINCQTKRKVDYKVSKHIKPVLGNP